MKLSLQRFYKAPSYTIGKFYIDNIYFCDTLEDTDRDLSSSQSLSHIASVKVPHETAIPRGTYDVSLTFSPHFQRTLPYLHSVPGFEGILIHRGNTAKDTSGCILLGENKVKGSVINSTPYEKKLIEMLKISQTPISITIL